jgi:hypothetical protein
VAAPLSLLAFGLATAAVIGNDALQTLGTFLAASRQRVPRGLQALFLCSVLCLVLLLGWSRGQGDPAWGRLDQLAEPARLTWVDLLPPLAVLGLTQAGAPVSTSFLLLTAFAPDHLPTLLGHSLAAYGLALALGLAVYAALPGMPAEANPAEARLTSGWLVLQWLASGWLWSQWLIQDLANLYVLLPRRLDAGTMAATLALLCLAVTVLVLRDGGPIQALLERKSHSDDPRATALLTGLYGAVLFGLGQWSRLPLSTTWAFLGLLAGRELGLLLRGDGRQATSMPASVAADLGTDLLRASLGLVVAVAVALLVAALHGAGR